MQELIAVKFHPFYYKTDKPSREVDFLLDLGHIILPIEVKSGEKTYSKSLGEYIMANNIQRAIKLSYKEYREHGKGSVDYISIYLAGKVADLI